MSCYLYESHNYDPQFTGKGTEAQMGGTCSHFKDSCRNQLALCACVHSHVHGESPTWSHAHEESPTWFHSHVASPIWSHAHVGDAGVWLCVSDYQGGAVTRQWHPDTGGKVSTGPGRMAYFQIIVINIPQILN